LKPGQEEVGSSRESSHGHIPKLLRGIQVVVAAAAAAGVEDEQHVVIFVPGTPHPPAPQLSCKEDDSTSVPCIIFPSFFSQGAQECNVNIQR
jgi:hypothetical protein